MMLALAQTMRALPAGGAPAWVMIVVCAGAAVVFGLGAWFVWSGRRGGGEGRTRTALERWRAGMSVPSRAAVGLTLMIVAYHGAAWVSPWQAQLLAVPLERWYVVAGAALLVVGLTLLTDWVEARGQGGARER